MSRHSKDVRLKISRSDVRRLKEGVNERNTPFVCFRDSAAGSVSTLSIIESFESDSKDRSYLLEETHELRLGLVVWFSLRESRISHAREVMLLTVGQSWESFGRMWVRTCCGSVVVENINIGTTGSRSRCDVTLKLLLVTRCVPFRRRSDLSLLWSCEDALKCGYDDCCTRFVFFFFFSSKNAWQCSRLSWTDFHSTDRLSLSRVNRIDVASSNDSLIRRLSSCLGKFSCRQLYSKSRSSSRTLGYSVELFCTSCFLTFPRTCWFFKLGHNWTTSQTPSLFA